MKHLMTSVSSLLCLAQVPKTYYHGCWIHVLYQESQWRIFCLTPGCTSRSRNTRLTDREPSPGTRRRPTSASPATTTSHRHRLTPAAANTTLTIDQKSPDTNLSSEKTPVDTVVHHPSYPHLTLPLTPPHSSPHLLVSFLIHFLITGFFRFVCPHRVQTCSITFSRLTDSYNQTEPPSDEVLHTYQISKPASCYVVYIPLGFC